MLSGAGYRTPTSVFVHGHVTVDGQKMSKRRRTFIPAATFAQHLDPDYLRYYYAAKLGPGMDDLDLNFTDFVAKVNSDLVGKLVNIASRCAGFVHKLGGGRLAATLPDPALHAEFAAAADDLASDFEQRDFARAVRKIMALADRANQYIDERKPWLLAKTPGKETEIVGISTLGLNLFRVLMIYLKPIVPKLAARAEKLLAAGELTWQDAGTPLLARPIAPFEPLLTRVEPASVQAIVGTAPPESSAPPPVTEKPKEPGMPEIDLAQFQTTDLRVAKVVEAAYVDGADKLLRLTLDIGTEQRTVFSGIRRSYDPATLVGRLVILVANLAPRKMRFGVSQGMVLAASGEEDGIFLLSPDSGAKPGMKVS
jgi:methionyl-tRNA synthetase